MKQKTKAKEIVGKLGGKTTIQSLSKKARYTVLVEVARQNGNQDTATRLMGKVRNVKEDEHCGRCQTSGRDGQMQELERRIFNGAKFSDVTFFAEQIIYGPQGADFMTGAAEIGRRIFPLIRGAACSAASEHYSDGHSEIQLHLQGKTSFQMADAIVEEYGLDKKAVGLNAIGHLMDVSGAWKARELIGKIIEHCEITHEDMKQAIPHIWKYLMHKGWYYGAYCAARYHGHPKLAEYTLEVSKIVDQGISGYEGIKEQLKKEKE